MNHIESIELDLKNKKPLKEIIRKVYLTYPTKALIGNEESQYEILNEISGFFNVPIMNIQVAGSAKIGQSLHKGREFIEGESDLDIAIIDQNLFLNYMQQIFEVTKGYSDRTKFPFRNGVSTDGEYLNYLTKGIFRADLMPTCEARRLWNQFFGQLSKRHGKLFKSINAGIYLSQLFFENKQRSAINKYKLNRGV